MGNKHNTEKNSNFNSSKDRNVSSTDIKVKQSNLDKKKKLY